MVLQQLDYSRQGFVYFFTEVTEYPMRVSILEGSVKKTTVSSRSGEVRRRYRRNRVFASRSPATDPIQFGSRSWRRPLPAPPQASLFDIFFLAALALSPSMCPTYPLIEIQAETSLCFYDKVFHYK